MGSLVKEKRNAGIRKFVIYHNFELSKFILSELVDWRCYVAGKDDFDHFSWNYKL